MGKQTEDILSVEMVVNKLRALADALESGERYSLSKLEESKEPEYENVIYKVSLRFIVKPNSSSNEP